jgi:hypothetical protein
MSSGGALFVKSWPCHGKLCTSSGMAVLARPILCVFVAAALMGTWPSLAASKKTRVLKKQYSSDDYNSKNFFGYLRTALKLQDRRTEKLYCSAVLVAQDLAITAAHCMDYVPCEFVDWHNQANEGFGACVGVVAYDRQADLAFFRVKRHHHFTRFPIVHFEKVRSLNPSTPIKRHVYALFPRIWRSENWNYVHEYSHWAPYVDPLHEIVHVWRNATRDELRFSDSLVSENLEGVKHLYNTIDRNGTMGFVGHFIKECAVQKWSTWKTSTKSYGHLLKKLELSCNCKTGDSGSGVFDHEGALIGLQTSYMSNNVAGLELSRSGCMVSPIPEKYLGLIERQWSNQ